MAQFKAQLPVFAFMLQLLLHLPCLAYSFSVLRSKSGPPFQTSLRVQSTDYQPTTVSSSPSPVMIDPNQRWYSHADLDRDRTQILEGPMKVVAKLSTSKFVLVNPSRGVFHYTKVNGQSNNGATEPLFLTFGQLEQVVGEKSVEDSLEGEEESNLLAWVGKHGGSDYFVYHLAKDERSYEEEDLVLQLLNKNSSHDLDDNEIRVAGLREFGDRLSSSMDAAILATSNGLVEFHRVHPFCSRCGSRTKAVKGGSCRKCVSSTCGASVYPRIDVAAIMLITSECEQYALLGRKANWPQGRYSTLAGFCEVGETLEQCCVREVLEESGVQVNLNTVEFVCSQPWPFPRSLMAGFRGKAAKTESVVDGLPKILVDENELEDAQWFHKDYVKQRLGGGSTARNFVPNDSEKEFHIPGPSSLARLLITMWATDEK